MPMYLTQAIHKGRRERAGATAAICGAEQASWSQLAQRIERCAGLLRALDVAPGDPEGFSYGAGDGMHFVTRGMACRPNQGPAAG